MKKAYTINVIMDTESGKVTGLDIAGEAGRTEVVSDEFEDEPITVGEAIKAIREELEMNICRN